MRRAIVLIFVMAILSVGLGLWADFSQQAVAYRYLDNISGLRGLAEQGRHEEAAREQAYVYAQWEGDAKRLNCLVSHHHTRAVTTAMMQLSTALEYGWKDEALQALDMLEDALKDIAVGDFPYWENIL